MEEILSDVVRAEGDTSFTGLIEELDICTSRSRTMQLWTDYLVQVVIIMRISSHLDVYADEAVMLGKLVMKYFRVGRPVSVPVSKLAITVDMKQRHMLVPVVKERIYDQKFIYARVIDLLAKSTSMLKQQLQLVVSDCKSLKKRAVVDIHATKEAHHDIAGDLLAIHVLYGEDSVASLHGIGKALVLRICKT